MSSYIGLQLRSRQLAGEAHKDYSSTARGVAQPSGRSVALFPSGCLLVRCCGSWWAHRLGQGRLGHKLAWSQAGLVTAGMAGRKEGVFSSDCNACATGSRLAQTSRKGPRLPAQFRIPSRSLPLPMSVGGDVFYCPWLFGPRGRPNLHKNLSGDVAGLIGRMPASALPTAFLKDVVATQHLCIPIWVAGSWVAQGATLLECAVGSWLAKRTKIHQKQRCCP